MVGLVHVWSLSELIPWKFTSSIWPKVILLFALGLAGWWLLLRSGPGFGVILLLGLSVLVAAGIFYPLRVVLAGGFLLTLVLSLLFGIDAGDLARSDPVRPQLLATTSRGELSVTLIRSGEIGLLFYNREAQQVEFMRWDGVKRITTARPAASIMPSSFHRFLLR